VLREADLIEEVGRHYGFDKLEPTFPAHTQPAPAPDPRIPRDQTVRRLLTAAGLSEAITFGFVEAKAAALFAGNNGVVGIANPLSAKFDTLRPLVLAGLVDVVAYNRRHGRRDVALFEIGSRFSTEGETRGVGIAWTGAATPEHWSARPREVDFFDIKGVIESLCGTLGIEPRFEATRQPFLAPGQSAAVRAASGHLTDVIVACFGRLTPEAAEARGLPRQDRVFVGELNLDLVQAARTPTDEAVSVLPRHPSIVRDVSIVISDTLPAEIIRGTILAASARASAPLASVSIFDRYHGKEIPTGSVSLSFRLTFRAPDRTLTDEEAQRAFDTIVAALVGEHGAVLR
jgi:phenylalanyl-tRNA synthetase beta chain